MNIKCVVVGELEENCYVLEKNNKGIIIDPGDEPEKIESEIKELNIVGILLTHNHFDHIGALEYFENKYNLKHNDNIPEFNYEIISTPGHTKDSKTFYFPDEKVMFTGDFLFKGTIGRMDLPGGSIEEMKKSIGIISAYPNDIIIYPGHGDFSILGNEKSYFRFYL